MGVCSDLTNNNKRKILAVDLRNSIKSYYILEHIFSYLNINEKLDLIKYNQEIQKKLNINIENYKLISGRYFEGERNGKGKEFTLKDNKLIFEGEYLKGKKMEMEKNILIMVI